MRQAAFPALTLLSLEENQLAGWAEVAALAALPKLERLHLSGNLLPEVAPPEQGEGARRGAALPLPLEVAGRDRGQRQGEPAVCRLQAARYREGSDSNYRS